MSRLIEDLRGLKPKDRAKAAESYRQELNEMIGAQAMVAREVLPEVVARSSFSADAEKIVARAFEVAEAFVVGANRRRSFKTANLEREIAEASAPLEAEEIEAAVADAGEEDEEE